MKNYNLVVVGGGHAGIEAALSAARLGQKVALVTMDPLSIGRMSCNPAIGGLGKAHLVHEIDALGGLMGRAADTAGIQFKTLNTSKGRAVWSLRAQVDKKIYPQFIQNQLLLYKNISLLQDEVVDFSVDNSRVVAVLLACGRTIGARALIVCSGTFLNGIIHIGANKYAAGRYGEKPAARLSQNIINKGFITSRLKTGTPPRILSSSIDWSVAMVSGGDKVPNSFSILTPRPFHPKNLPSYIVNTNSNVHEILSDNLGRSAMYSGAINAVGPRYCPSIEDKVVRFSDRNKHQLFLEPEWAGSNQIYVNGFSTSMPRNIQEAALRQIPALKFSKLIRPGYAIEYDHFPTHQLKSTLESKHIEGLYFAGQLNGTSGYEEAAAQGLVAGTNAALKILDKEPFVLRRDQAYIGVLIDDLITKDINEPYRMFTSSAEYRLSLRSDSAPLRLTQLAFQIGLISDKQYEIYSSFRNSVHEIKKLCAKEKMACSGGAVSLEEYLRRPNNNIHDANSYSDLANRYSRDAIFTAETDIKYAGYVKIEGLRINKLRKLDGIIIPPEFNYNDLVGLSNESRERLVRVRPETLGQASRLAGIRTSDLNVLAIYIQSRK